MQPQNPLDPQQQYSTPPPEAQYNVAHPSNYDFITNPPKPPRNNPLLGANSMLMRIIILGGGLLILLVLFSVVKNIVSPPPKLDAMVTVAQDQEELIHLTSPIFQIQGVSTVNKNLASTTLLTITSSQQQTLTYLKTQHFKVKPKVLGLKINQTIDTQLLNAQAAGTFNPTFNETLQTQLKIYGSDIQQAYKQITGKNGRSILTDQYKQAQLLFLQASSTAN